MSCNQSIQIKIGTDVLIPFAVTDNGTAKNITGYTLIMTAKKNISDDDSAALFQLTDIKVNAAIGTTKFTISATETEAFEEGEYIADVKVFDAAGNKMVTDTFMVTVTSPVTQKNTL